MLFACDIVLTLFLCCLPVTLYWHCFYTVWLSVIIAIFLAAFMKLGTTPVDSGVVIAPWWDTFVYIMDSYSISFIWGVWGWGWGGVGGVGRDWGVSEWEMYWKTNLWWVRELHTTHSVTLLNLEWKWALSRLALKLQFSLSLAVSLTTLSTLPPCPSSPPVCVHVCMCDDWLSLGSHYCHLTL